MPKSQPLLIPLSDALAAIREEPELHGPMPDEAWNEIKGDRTMTEAALNMVVRQAKKGIRDRLKEKAQLSATLAHGKN